MTKRKIIRFTFIASALIIASFFCYTVYQRKNNDFEFSIVESETIAFLQERTSIMEGKKGMITYISDFYKPKDKFTEKKLREKIYAYYTYLQQADLNYENPILKLEVQKVQKKGRSKAIVVASEEVMMDYGKEKTGYGNQHKFIYEKRNGKWKLIDNQFLKPYSIMMEKERDIEVDI